MKIQHSPHHWIAVALVLAVLLLTLSEPTARAAARKRAKAPWQDRPKAESRWKIARTCSCRDVKPSRTGVGDFDA